MSTAPAVRRLAPLVAALFLCDFDAGSQGLSESTGVGQYFANCARCHEGADAPQAPRTAVLKQMAPERIYESLTTGTMRTQAGHLTDQEKRVIAEWVGGRKIDNDLAGAADKMIESMRQPRAGSAAHRAGLERLGRRPSQLALATGRCGRSLAGSGVASRAQVGLRLSRSDGPLQPDAHRRAAVCNLQRGIRLFARRGHGLCALVLPLAVGRAQRLYRRPDVADVGPPGRLLRRHPRHGVRARCEHRRGDLEDADGSASARAHHRNAGASREPRVRACRFLEEPESGQADYACCTFRGYLAALDAATGEPIWKTYTIPETPKVVGKNSRGKDMLAPAGAGIWVTPILDLKRRALYFGTGNAFSGTPATANAIMAIHMDTGKILWSMQALPLDVWHNGCPQTIPGVRAGDGVAGRHWRRRARCRCRGWTRTHGRYARRRHPVPCGELSESYGSRLGFLRSAGARHDG